MWDLQTDIGQTCVLEQKEIITDKMESEKFEFVGLNDFQKKNIRTICFQTSRVAFVPKESVKQFTELDGIAIIETDLRILEFSWLEKFLKFVKKNIKNLYFHENKIEMIDPRIMSIFSKMDRVFLRKNNCIQEGFPITNKDPAIMKLELRTCIENYENSRGTLPLLSIVPNVNQTLIKRLNEIEKQIKKNKEIFTEKLGKLEKTLDKVYAMGDKILKKFDELNVIELYCSNCDKNGTSKIFSKP